MDNRVGWIRLQQALGPGSPKAEILLRAFGSPDGIFEASERDLRELGLKQSETKALADASVTAAERILRTSLKNNGWVLTPDDALYPESLREIYALPLVLYGQGEWPDFNTVPALTLVGPREATAYGAGMARYIATGMAAAGAIIVSGGATGIDAAAHWGALQAGGCTVAVQGGGLDQDYPRQNEPLRRQIIACGGAVISEYPPGTPSFGGHYPIRNRILSGLSWATCVVEAPMGSGSLITATHAREQGREVMAVPAPAGIPAYAGTNALIRQGAYLVEGPRDILRQYRDRFGDLLRQDAADAIAPPRWKLPEPVKTEQPPALIAAQEKPSLFSRRKRTKKAVPAADPAPTSPTPTPPQTLTTCPDGVSDDARRMFEHLDGQPIPIDRLAAQAGLTPARAMAVLTELEIAGAARSHAGQQYSRQTV